MASFLPYNPGVLPTKPPPSRGEVLRLEVQGFPPIKDLKQSIRNRNHRLHARFLALRDAATEAMAGRAWVFSRIQMQVVIRAPDHEENYRLNDYLGGIADTLDGSSGRSFTFLPIVYEDDAQIWRSESTWEEAAVPNYSITITFL